MREQTKNARHSIVEQMTEWYNEVKGGATKCIFCWNVCCYRLYKWGWERKILIWNEWLDNKWVTVDDDLNSMVNM